MLPLLQEHLEILSTICASQEAPQEFTGEDLVHTLQILQFVAHSISWNSQHIKGLDMPERIAKAEKFGQALRKAVEEFTGLNLAEEIRKKGTVEINLDIETS